MDITNLNGMYTDIAGAQNTSAHLEKMKADYKKLGKGTEEEKLMDACKQFEAYFIEQMYKEMYKTIPEQEYSSNSSKSSAEMYRDMFIKEMASQTTENGDLGLARMLFENMKVTLNAVTIDDIRNKKEQADAKEPESEEGSEGAVPDVSGL